ncbi:MAG: transketolase [Deltaproteobacteria bacterium]|nr:transketolase [Deltaproteobacteria bacterium]
MADPSVDLLCVNTIRTLAIDTIQKAKSGHPGLPMGAAPMAYVLWQRHLRHDPADPRWPDRDRFVLSAGHGSSLLYGLLHLTGYDVTLDDLKSFRQWDSRTPGHPEFHVTAGVEATTGPLGQGCANAVGMAMAERALAHRFNRPGHTIVDHYTFALVGDGDLMEGLASEAGSLAGHLKLGKLIYLYDSNDISLDGPTSMAFTEDVGRRYEAFGWQVLLVEHGDTDLEAIDRAIAQAKADSTRPSLIIVKTTIGYGAPNKQGKAAAHGSPLGADEIALVKKAFGFDPAQSFAVSEQARARFLQGAARGKAARESWQAAHNAYAKDHPALAAAFGDAMQGKLPVSWDKDLPVFPPGDGEATRQSGGKVLNAVAKSVESLLGGDADLSSSTQTTIKDAGAFDGQTGAGRNIHFGVREHAMAAIANGIAYHGGLRPFVSTFFCFADYMRPSIRLAALSKLPVIYVFTHDSVAVGEDGPTHQPIEHLMSLRAFPGLDVVRPCDANETAEAWRYAMQSTDHPVAIVLTRQKQATLDRSRLAPASESSKGGYVLSEASGPRPDAIVIATGSEVHEALQAQKQLESEGVKTRVVSMPCWEAFAAQPAEYRNQVLPPAVRARVSIEAGVTFGWSSWIGDAGVAVGIDRYGASAPGDTLMAKLGLTGPAVVEAVKAALANARS